MNRALKCCRSKDFANFCCITCSSIFHPSCLERYKEVVKLGGYRIYCSSECQKRAIDDEERVGALLEEIERLKREIEGRDHCIKRLDRRSREFEDEVSEAEEKYNQQVLEMRDKIARLNRELSELRQKNLELQGMVQDDKLLVTKLESDIKEISSINENMLISIRTLESENDVYRAEIKDLKQSIEASLLICPPHRVSGDGLQLSTEDNSDLLLKNDSNSTGDRQNQNENFADPNTDPSGSNACSDRPLLRRPQLLIMGGEDAVGLLSLFRRYTNYSCDINCQTNVRDINDRIQRCIGLSRGFNEIDSVVLLIGSGDVKKGRMIGDSLQSLLEKCSGCNLFIVGPTLWTNRSILNKEIQRHDVILQNYIQQWPKVHYLPSRSRTPNGRLNYSTKVKLAELLSYFILNGGVDQDKVTDDDGGVGQVGQDKVTDDVDKPCVLETAQEGFQLLFRNREIP